MERIAIALMGLAIAPIVAYLALTGQLKEALLIS